MANYQKIIILFLLMFSSELFAGDLTKWNGAVGRAVRQDMTAKATYKELSVKDVGYSRADPNMVYPQIELKGQMGGSATGVTIDAMKVPLDLADYAKIWGPRIGKVGAGIALGLSL